MTTTGVQLEFSLEELVAIGDLVAHLVSDGRIHEWARTHHADDPLPHHAGVALCKLAVRLEEAGERLAATR